MSPIYGRAGNRVVARCFRLASTRLRRSTLGVSTGPMYDSYQRVSDDAFWAKVPIEIEDIDFFAKPSPKEVTDMRAFLERRIPLFETVQAWVSSARESTRRNIPWVLSFLLAEGIKAFPKEHERVLDFIDVLFKIASDEHKAIDDAGSSKARRDGFWSLVLYLRDALQVPEDECYLPGRCHQWINTCAFWARMAVRDHSSKDIEGTFFLRVGVMHIYEMLETAKNDTVVLCKSKPIDGPIDSNASLSFQTYEEEYVDKKEPRHYNVDLPACCQWIQIAGEEIYRLRYQRDAFAPQLPIDHERNKSEFWKGELGFSTERWRFWKERILQIKDLPEISSDTKQVADQTIAEMNRIEATMEEHPLQDSRFGPKAWAKHLDGDYDEE